VAPPWLRDEKPSDERLYTHAAGRLHRLTGPPEGSGPTADPSGDIAPSHLDRARLAAVISPMAIGGLIAVAVVSASAVLIADATLRPVGQRGGTRNDLVTERAPAAEPEGWALPLAARPAPPSASTLAAMPAVDMPTEAERPAAASIPAPAKAEVAAPSRRDAAAGASGSSPAVRLDRNDIAFFTARAQELITAGDLSSARLLLQRAADAGDARAALTLGSTYDPAALRKLGMRQAPADTTLARIWYEKARELGAPEAAGRLDRLAATAR
jgi:hypothetical protein